MTTQATHTKGPWHTGQGNGEGSIFCESGRMRLESGGTTLYPVCAISRGWDEGEDEANARLIAAAPDLLEACKELVKHLDSLPDDTEKCRHLKMALNNRAGDLMLAAIAKVEGRAE
jgi:hypothetical protein